MIEMLSMSFFSFEQTNPRIYDNVRRSAGVKWLHYLKQSLEVFNLSFRFRFYKIQPRLNLSKYHQEEKKWILTVFNLGLRSFFKTNFVQYEERLLQVNSFVTYCDCIELSFFIFVCHEEKITKIYNNYDQIFLFNYNYLCPLRNLIQKSRQKSIHKLLCCYDNCMYPDIFFNVNFLCYW